MGDKGPLGALDRHAGGGGVAQGRSDNLPAHLIRIAQQHHERLDGSGYPNGLAGDQIDEPSLLCAIADVQPPSPTAPYRDPLAQDLAFERMRQLAGQPARAGAAAALRGGDARARLAATEAARAASAGGVHGEILT